MKPRTTQFIQYQLKSIIALLLFFFSLLGCNKFVEVDPPITSTNGEIIFRDDATAIAAITSVYTNMSNENATTITGYPTNIFFTTGLASDELELWDKSNPLYGSYYFNNISPLPNTWSNIYKMIFLANSAIEELPKNSSVTLAVKNQLLGEALFIRAFCYFYLVNLYGGVPLAIVTDYKETRLLPRSTPSQVYQQIVTDLKAAQLWMTDNYVGKDGISLTNERVRPNKWAAIALLARTYLYMGNYSGAVQQSTAVINNSAQYVLVNLNDVFIKNSPEAIWQLQPVGTGFYANPLEGQLLKLLNPPSAFYPVYLRQSLVNSFENRDLRKKDWINKYTDTASVPNIEYFYSYKYKIGLEAVPVNEYSTILRLAEQYLIRAESNIQLNNVSTGISDLNIIRKRATDLTVPLVEQLPPLQLTLSKIDALKAVESERRHELFTEWGHRWFDLKRMKGINDPSKSRADEVLGAIKGSNWQSTDQLFPIPNTEILGANPNMKGAQNPGYN
jgi:hypothetical protein